jgi:hypothetical protein
MKNEMIKWITGAALLLNGAAGAQTETNRITELEQRLSAMQAELDQLNQPSGLMTELGSRLQFEFLLEAETFYAQSAGESESDLTLATAEIAVDAEITEGVSAHLGLLWEEDLTTDDNLDEAYVTFGATDDLPYYLTVGKTYLPFGNFSSAFISDPLTLELAEINETAALIGYANGRVEVAAGAFKGDSEETDTLENWVVSITATPCSHSEIGIYWISDLVETDGLEAFVDAEKEAGAGVFLNAHIGDVMVNAEFLTALSDIETAAGDLKPSAYNVEASMPITDQLTLGAKFEGSNDFYADLGADKFADKQYGIVAAYAINEYVTVAGEYLHAEGLDDNEDGDLATVQLSVVF